MFTIMFDRDDECLIYENQEQVIRATTLDIWEQNEWPENVNREDWKQDVLARLKSDGVNEIRWILTGIKVQITSSESRLQSVE